MLDKVGVERGLEINPNKTSLITLLGREDVCNKVVSIEEPPRAEDVENIEHRGLESTIWSSNWLGARRGGVRGRNRSRGRRVSLLHPFGQGRGKGKASNR